MTTGAASNTGVAVYRADLERTGVYPSGGPTKRPKLVWKFKTGADSVVSSPAVLDGVVYVGSADHFVYAVDAKSGEQRWKFETNGSISSSPAVSDGVVYIVSGGADICLYALDAATARRDGGSRRARTSAPTRSSRTG